MADQERGKLRNERHAEADTGRRQTERHAAMIVEPMGDHRSVWNRGLHPTNEAGDAEDRVDKSQWFWLHEAEAGNRESKQQTAWNHDAARAEVVDQPADDRARQCHEPGTDAQAE